ncbi:MAG: hypothetical protein LC808_36920, partial [Actinobacteria bacterium]|nr:hypothetical protein [Actinomycetota bacterium]
QIHQNYRFATCSTPILDTLHSIFYPDGSVKRISPSIDDFVTSSLSLAVWYMDDGGRRGDCRSGYLNTNAYSIDGRRPTEVLCRRTFRYSNGDALRSRQTADLHPKRPVLSVLRDSETACDPGDGLQASLTP